MNIVEPHYARVQYSVQTRCQIMEIKEDEYIPHDLWHYAVWVLLNLCALS